MPEDPSVNPGTSAPTIVGQGFNIMDEIEVEKDETKTIIVNITADNGIQNLKVKIDSGTQPGKVLRLRGKGLPNVNGYGTGDLLVNISIYVPEALNKEEKSTLEKMEASDNFKPNTSVKEKIFKKFKSFFD